MSNVSHRAFFAMFSAGNCIYFRPPGDIIQYRMKRPTEVRDAIYQDARRGQRLCCAGCGGAAARHCAGRPSGAGIPALRPAHGCGRGRRDGAASIGDRCGRGDAVLQLRRFARRDVRQRRALCLPLRLRMRLCGRHRPRGNDGGSRHRLAAEPRPVPHPAQYRRFWRRNGP